MLSRRNLLASMLLSGIPAFASEVKDWDVIVVGTGVAGLAAACSALEAGAGNVLILEKSPVVGGHSSYRPATLQLWTSRDNKEPALKVLLLLCFKTCLRSAVT